MKKLSILYYLDLTYKNEINLYKISSAQLDNLFYFNHH